MTKPSSSLPVLYARVPQATVSLAQTLASRDGKSMTSWLIDLIETQRPRLKPASERFSEMVRRMHLEDHGPAVAAVAPVKRGRGRPRKTQPTYREDAHERAAESACSSGDE